MKYVSGWIVWGIYTWLGWSGEVAEPIGSSVPVRAHYFLLAIKCSDVSTCIPRGYNVVVLSIVIIIKIGLYLKQGRNILKI